MTAGETYPKISRKIWWLLRDRLKKSVPSTISPTIISALSPMADASARANVIAPLRQLGLIDDGSKPTDLAERWRHDDEYTKVCHEIRAKVYPQELIEAFPEASASQRDAVKSWFMKVGQIGESAAAKYTDTYMLLSEADPSKAGEKSQPDSAPRAARAVSKPKAARSPAPSKPEAPSAPPPSPQLPAETGTHARRLPAIHIDVQVHISPDTPPDQIDRIFESMAKHLSSFIK